jgi:hypothetical protein
MVTLVVDTGKNIVGIYTVENRTYISYMDDAIPEAIRRIQDADELVTYNGKWYDLLELGKFAGLENDLPIKGVHRDMRSICWSDDIYGSSLESTYYMNFSSCKNFLSTHEGSNERDVYMTFKLWELWKQRRLKIIDGHAV